MVAGFKEKGWEFWLGVAFVVAAAAMLIPAFGNEAWREIVSQLDPSIAGFAVVGASLIAYSGAVAKVRLDRAIEQEQSAQRQKNLYLRTHMAAAELLEATAAVRRRLLEIDKAGTGLGAPEKFYTADYMIEEPEELREAWNALDNIPAVCIPPMRAVRLHIGRLTRTLEALNQFFVSEHHLTDRSGFVFARLAGLLDETQGIIDQCEKLLHHLQPKVDEYNQPTPQQA